MAYIQSGIFLLIPGILKVVNCIYTNQNDSQRGHQLQLRFGQNKDVTMDQSAQSVVPNIPQSEYDALFELYNSTDGSNWRWNASLYGIPWDFSDVDANPCADNWQGITCTNISDSNYIYVEKIELVFHNMRGTLPVSIGEFPQLEELILSENMIRNPLPEALTGLTLLQSLKIDRNLFDGTFPKFLGDLLQLRIIDLSFNDFTGPLPDSFRNLQQLEVLDIGNTGINGTIPEFLGDLTQLQEITMINGELTGSLPESLIKCSGLVGLILTSNKLTGSLPPAYGSFQNLQLLRLGDNRLNGTIPLEIGILRSIVGLYLEGNRFSGTIPDHFFNLTQLEVLDLSSNRLSGTLPLKSTISLQYLRVIGLSHNHLTGQIPNDLEKLAQLEKLELAFNSLSGTISETLGRLQSLTEMDIYFNGLTGTIPESISTIPHLGIFSAASNMLTGTLPESFVLLQELGDLSFYDNDLTGTIPNIFDNLTEINSIYLQNNLLTGTLPLSLGSAQLLEFLYLDDNYLEGQIPPFFSQLSNLVVMMMQNNVFTGSVVDVFNASVQTALRTVQLSGNQLTGNLPVEAFRLPRLKTFAVVSNCFTGSLPMQICNSRLLQTLVLDGLHSATSCRGVFLTWIDSYYLTGNIFGGIPSCLFELPHLHTLHLSGNGLTGTIPNPSEIHRSLVDLTLAHNELTGTIPKSIQENTWYSIDLSHNKLSGALSAGFASTGYIESNSTYQGDVSVSLDNNRLSGDLPTVLLNENNISVLAGNLFSCNLLQSNLPKHDPDAEAYECGSNSFNLSYYAWLSCILFLPLLILVLLRWRNIFDQYIGVSYALSYYSKWMNVLEQPITAGVRTMSIEETSTTTPFTNSGTSSNISDNNNSHLVYDNNSSNSKDVDTTHGDTTDPEGNGSKHQPSQPMPQLRKFKYVMRVCDRMTRLGTICTTYIVVVLATLDIILSRFYGTHLYAYAWIVSSSFISGYVAFSLQLVVFLLLIVFLFYRLSIVVDRNKTMIREQVDGAGDDDEEDEIIQRRKNKKPSGGHRIRKMGDGANTTSINTYNNGDDEKEEEEEEEEEVVGQGHDADQQEEDSSHKFSSKQEKLLLYAAYFFVNTVIVIGANVAYVYVSLYQSYTLTIITQMLMSVFKLFWNSVASAYLIRWMYHYMAKTSTTDWKAKESGFFFVQVFVSLFNYITIPVLVVAVVSPNCFNNLIVGQSSVDSVFVYEVCVHYNEEGTCLKELPYAQTTSYKPPFTYSLECSSAVITYYAPTFIYLSFIVTFLLPLGMWTAQKLHERARAREYTRWFHFLDYWLPPILLTVTKDNRLGVPYDIFNPYFDAGRLFVTLVTYIGILLTFGVIFPPLAVAMLIAIFALTLQFKLYVGRFTTIALEAGLYKYIGIIEAECKGVASVPKIRQALRLWMAFSCTFFSIFLFDTLGDTAGTHHAYWILLCLPLFPLFLQFTYKSYMYFQQWCRKMNNSRNTDQRANQPPSDQVAGVELHSLSEVPVSLDVVERSRSVDVTKDNQSMVPQTTTTRPQPPLMGKDEEAGMESVLRGGGYPTPNPLWSQRHLNSQPEDEQEQDYESKIGGTADGVGVEAREAGSTSSICSTLDGGRATTQSTASKSDGGKLASFHSTENDFAAGLYGSTAASDVVFSMLHRPAAAATTSTTDSTTP